MAFSIFDLYSHYPDREVRFHGPYEFSKVHKRNSFSSTSSDSFRLLETRKPSRQMLPPCPAPPLKLGAFQHIVRRSITGDLIRVVRRKDFAPVKTHTLSDVGVAELSLKSKHPVLRVEKAKLRWGLGHSYMENRQHWDIVNTMLKAKHDTLMRHKGQYRRSKTLEVFRNFRRTSSTLSFSNPKQVFKRKPKLYRSMTKLTMDPSPREMKAVPRDLNRSMNRDPVSLEEWKDHIRKRAAALVYGPGKN